MIKPEEIRAIYEKTGQQAALGQRGLNIVRQVRDAVLPKGSRYFLVVNHSEK